MEDETVVIRGQVLKAHPVMPSRVGGYWANPDQNYFIVICEDGETLDLTIGFTGKSPKGCAYRHPLATTTERQMDFNHTSPSGHKSWSTAQGVEHTFTIPRSKVLLTRDCGYSYPKVIIEGEEITLNTSGGSYRDGWGDFIYGSASSVVNGPLAWLTALEKIAIVKEVVNE